VLLLAVKTFDFDQCLPLLACGEAVIEGRGLDSIAVYQSLITCPDDIEGAHAEARAILAIAAQWRPLPDRTILVAHDVTTAIGRSNPPPG
jgi:dTMP kinase